MTREIEVVFTDVVCRFRQDTEGFVFTERERALLSSLPSIGMKIQIDGVWWAVVRDETIGDYRIGEYRVVDQGMCLHDYERSELSKVIEYINNDATDVPNGSGADPTASEDDFWFIAEPSRNQLMVCLGFPDRAYLQYVRGPNHFDSYDPTFSGPSVMIWDPGMSTRDIPRVNFIMKDFAIEIISEFFDCGFVSIDDQWKKVF